MSLKECFWKSGILEQVFNFLPAKCLFCCLANSIKGLKVGHKYVFYVFECLSHKTEVDKQKIAILFTRNECVAVVFTML